MTRGGRRYDADGWNTINVIGQPMCPPSDSCALKRHHLK